MNGLWRLLGRTKVTISTSGYYGACDWGIDLGMKLVM